MMQHLQSGDYPACEDCQFYHAFEEAGGKDCHHDACSMYSPVEGRLPVRASAARGDPRKCGPDARYFQARPEPDQSKRITLLIIAGTFLAWAAKVGGWW
jgi:hypothetical protein